MNTHLENAFAKAALLSDDAQESIASMVLAEIEAERVWDQVLRPAKIRSMS